jgi:hypothetical protein
METKPNKTTISVKRSTVERLSAFGMFGETYDDIIVRFLESEENREKEEIAKEDDER